jgi:hypothetical protein
LGHHRPLEGILQANGLDANRSEQLKEIRKVNEKLAERGTAFRLLTASGIS